MRKVQRIIATSKTYGINWLIQRSLYELQVRSGLQKLRFRKRQWDTNELARWIKADVPTHVDSYVAYWRENRQPFFFQSTQRTAYNKALNETLGSVGVERLLNEAHDIQKGDFRFFSSQVGHLGCPPDWHQNPFTGQRTLPDDHWSDIPMYSIETGDLKYIWEQGRFASAYVLARAYWASGDETFVETFWQIIESWQRDNPPNHGAHWRCGQETSLRLMAWCFALYAFADAPATTPKRIANLIAMIGAQADRISHNHIYAHLQRNNHAISEGVGLWITGLLFPEFIHAQAWRTRGRNILVYEAIHQIGLDGSYIQNSFNYHRVMLQDYIYALRLGELCSETLPAIVYEQVQKAVNFLYEVQDQQTGCVPYYGNDDGALITPLNTSEYADFRPVLNAGYYLFHKKRLYSAGIWDEDLLWLFGVSSLESSTQTIAPTSLAATDGGYYTLRGKETFALTRCTTYQYRPGQADMLHMDLWWHGLNIACDPASYTYYAEKPWNTAMVLTDAHNTVTVDGQSQMERGPRFMWLTWTNSKVLAFRRSTSGNIEYFQGEHNGYSRLEQPVTHRRAIVRCGENAWVVVDDLLGEGAHTAYAHWLLTLKDNLDFNIKDGLHASTAQGDVQLQWSTIGFDGVADISSGNEADAPRGWRARHYGEREPALSLRMGGKTNPPCRIVTVFTLGAGDHQVKIGAERIWVNHTDQYTITLATLSQSERPVTSVSAANEILTG